MMPPLYTEHRSPPGLYGQKMMNRHLGPQTYCRQGGIASYKSQVYMKRERPIDTLRSSSFTMSRGEYISPDKIQNVLTTSRYIAQAFVYGDSEHAILVGIIVPEDYALLALAKRLTISSSIEELCQHPEIIKEILHDISIVSKEGKLYSFETVRRIALEATYFSIDNQLLQQNRKVARDHAKIVYQKTINELYAQEYAAK